MAQTYDMTQGRVAPQILRFYVPMFLTSLLQQVYNVADTAIVGKGIGDEALASVGNMSSICFLIFGFAMGLCNGFSVSIAQSFGAKNYDRLRHFIASALTLSAAIALILTVLGMTCLRGILTLMQTDSTIMGDSLTYGYILLGGLVTTISYNLCSCILRALGDSKTPFLAIVASTILNVVLDYLFVCVWHIGVAGAAIATVAAQVVSTLLCLMKLMRVDVIHLSRADFLANARNFLELLQNGIPMALMNSITAIGCIVVQYFVNGLGVVYTTAYSGCSKFINLFMQPSCTAGYTMSAFTSQNYGAGRYDRIRQGLRVCLRISLIGYLILGSVMVLFPRQLASLMMNGKESIDLAEQFLHITGVMLFAVDFLFVVRSGVQGMGHPTVPMLSGILEMVMRVSVIYLLIGSLGFRATAWAEVSAWVGALLLNGAALFYFLRKTRNLECPMPYPNPAAQKISM